MNPGHRPCTIIAVVRILAVVRGVVSHIPLVPEDEAGEELRQLFAQVKEALGFVPNLFQAQGGRPDFALLTMEMIKTLHSPGALPVDLKEKIGLVVSSANSNSYCIRMHLELLSKLGVELDIGKQLVRDFETADVPENEKALFRFADKLTCTPFDIKGSDVEELRRHGWNNAAILETTQAVSHFNYVNRLAAGLGVIPEDVF